MANFKARARTLDMLGRQQIAGIPTAISELFKNAHDAYADHVVADFFERENLFVLRDDGIGMSEADFTERWLVLGTESKVGALSGVRPPLRDTSKASRPVLGEKGIGRLSIAVIGPQVLILTRSKPLIREAKGQDAAAVVLDDTRLTAAFIHWGLFEIPGVNLDEVEVQIRTFESGIFPSKSDIESMVEAMRQNVLRLKGAAGEKEIERILEELKTFDLDPQALSARLRRPTLTDGGHGTHFFIKPASPSLTDNLRAKSDDDQISDLTRTLIGFSNTMTPGHETPKITPMFRHHRVDGSTAELIGEGEFFTPEDFRGADHRIEGTFDSFGQFTGTLSIFDMEPRPISISWNGTRGRETECGPFKISFAYAQGNASDSHLSPENWTRLTKRLNRMGGLYVYRDGIRVLPYGNTDFDFLDIEKRRSKSASFYFFSYRRMFGAVEITHTANDNLSEKAGREGFRDNRAYTQFKDILKNLLVQLAAEFFREEGAQTEIFRRRLVANKRLDKARKQRDKQVGAKRKAFQIALEKSGAKFGTGEPAQAVQSILEEFKSQVSLALEDPQADVQDKAWRLILAEDSAKRNLDDARKTYRVTRPSGVALAPALRRDYEASAYEWRRWDEEVVRSSEAQITREAAAAYEQLGTSVETRLRLEMLFQERAERIKRDTETKSRQVSGLIKDKSTQSASLVRDNQSRIVNEISAILAEVVSTDVVALGEEELNAWQTRMEERLSVLSQNNEALLEGLETQFQGLNLERDEQGLLIGATDEAEALEEDVLALRERADADFELSQLGLAIEVVGHEFASSIEDVRRNLRLLESWAKRNPSLAPLSQSLRSNFEHLDGYLTLFTPMNRRLYRSRSQLTGEQIAKFLRGLLEKQLEETEVELQTTESFCAKTIVGFPSTFYPVFVNLVDNAIFWVGNTPQPRIILLDADERGFTISDSGPGVVRADHNVIFEMRFSRKPGGRGLGLFIAREALAKEGYELRLIESGPLRGATFRIEMIDSETDNGKNERVI